MPEHGPELICPVGAGWQVHRRSTRLCRPLGQRTADQDITRDLRRRGLLYHQEQYLHDYPFCWRAEEDPLIQYPRKSWFIRTTQFKEQMLANNEQINWLPEHIKRRSLRQLSGDERRLGPVARALLGHAAADLGLRQDARRAHRKQSAAIAELLAKPGVSGTEVWEEAKRAEPRTLRPSEDS